MYSNQGGFGDGGDYDDDDMAPPTEVKKIPEGQIQGLTEEQLNEIFTKGISAGDPNVLKSTNVAYDYESGEYKSLPKASALAVHFFMEGRLLPSDSDEARDQAKFVDLIANRELLLASSSTSTTDDKKNAEEEASDDYPEVALSGTLPLKNQFNFSERATMTINNPMRQKQVTTEPPPTSDYKSETSQWDVYDTYLNEVTSRLDAAKELEQKKPVMGGKKKAEGEEDDVEVVNFDVGANDEAATPPALEKALKIMERIVHTNSESECFQDYKYFEDKSELKREDGRGSFLPLWRFAFSKAHRKTVTALSWNPVFTDLFAVGYGSYDFTKQTPGLICCFTLKNTSYPEYSFETESGVMSLDFHPVKSSLLCVGMYDGTVAVYDVRKRGGPIYTATNPKVKHTEPVWQVYWSRAAVAEDAEEPPLSFFSVSSDGRVTNWVLSHTDLLNDEVVTLKLSQTDSSDKAEEASTVVGLAGGSCFDFDKAKEHLFVVGTEEGSIEAYSREHNTQHVRKFGVDTAHHMAVYAVKWNTFHPDVFLSCSADWTVKLWEKNTTKPVMTWDLNTAVGDICWSPYSSTVFACITTDGKVRVYDLKVNKHEPIGETRVNKKSKLTHVSFNPTSPTVCVGDDRGVVTVLKLSSNLRKMSARTLHDVSVEDEIEKLKAVMIMPSDDGPEDVSAILERVKKAPELIAITEVVAE